MYQKFDILIYRRFDILTFWYIEYPIRYPTLLSAYAFRCVRHIITQPLSVVCQVEDYNKPEYQTPWDSEAAGVVDRRGSTISCVYLSFMQQYVYVYMDDRSIEESHTICKHDFPGKKWSHNRFAFFFWQFSTNIHTIDKRRKTQVYGVYTIIGDVVPAHESDALLDIRQRLMDPLLRRKAGLREHWGW